MRVCIVLLTGLGDVIHGLPLVSALKRADPSTHITWVVEPMPSWALRPHPAVDEVIVFERVRGYAGVRDLWRDMRRRRFDVTLNLNVYFKSVFPMLFSRARRRIGVDRRRTREGVWLFANRHIPPGPVKHTQDLFLDFLPLLGVEAQPLEWRLAPTEEEAERQRVFFDPLRQQGRPIVSIVTASGNEKKDWTPDGYAALIDVLEHDLGMRAMLVGGPGEREVALARAVAERARVAPLWQLGDSVRRLLWLLQGSDLVVAPDTGPLHMARAMDVPVIGLFGHTSPWRVGPYRKYQDLWVDHYGDPGSPADAASMESRLGRMETITPAEVLEKVELAKARYLGIRGAGTP
ncbi:MAG TPA: glycosyltransferase family 9 protein, partial [Longimicrobiales bacterium]